MKIVPIEVTYVQHCGSDLSVVNAARVSFNKLSSELDDKDIRLISYLASHGHISPFHHAFITLRVKAPVFVARQLVKHKFMPWNEVSRRYVDDEPEVFMPDVWREKPTDGAKQGSGKEMYWGNARSAKLTVEDNFEYALTAYRYLLDIDTAPEQARMVLPQNTMTEWCWSGALSAWASMLNLRMKADAQKETRDVAELAYNIIQPLFPHSLQALVPGHGTKS